MAIYRFSEANLEPSRAHLGVGEVLAARVRKRVGQSGLNFLDLVDVPPGVTIGRHRHSLHDEELYVIVEGTATMTIDGLIEHVGPGDVIFNRAGGTHSLSNHGDEMVRMVVIDLSIGGVLPAEPEDLSD
jgi:quercetin dioxygenase-like cupin family protein